MLDPKIKPDIMLFKFLIVALAKWLNWWSGVPYNTRLWVRSLIRASRGGNWLLFLCQSMCVSLSLPLFLKSKKKTYPWVRIKDKKM